MNTQNWVGAGGGIASFGTDENPDSRAVAAAQNAVITAQRTGRSLLDALMWYTAVGRAIKEAPTLDTCRVEYLRMKALAGVRPPTLKGHRVGLAQFCERFGRRKPFEVTSDDIAGFLGQWELSTTRVSCGRRLYGFFAWLVTQGFTAQNPLQLLPRPEYRAGSKDIYQAEEVRDILGRTWQTDQLGYWVLALFAGIRTSEIERIQASPNPWAFFRMADGVIEIPARLAKNRRRVIPINPTLRAWLRIIELRRIPFFPKNAVEKIRRVRKTVLRRTRAGCVPKCANMARRSYINYRLALPEASFAGVGQEAGNREPTLRKFYRRPTTRAAAREFWALTPRRIGVTAL